GGRRTTADDGRAGWRIAGAGVSFLGAVSARMVRWGRRSRPSGPMTGRPLEVKMGMFDKIIGAVSGKGEPGGLGQMLGIKLDDQSSLSGLIKSVTGSEGSGGISALLQRFTQAGQGDAVKSWIGTGANQPVTPDAVSSAIGQDKIAAFAQRLGVSPEEASAALAQILPQAVDKMTPNGRIEGEIV
ncbi:MAG: YidB family protein, partial [Alphaproteobacteria bacterium]